MRNVDPAGERFGASSEHAASSLRNGLPSSIAAHVNVSRSLYGLVFEIRIIVTPSRVDAATHPACELEKNGALWKPPRPKLAVLSEAESLHGE
ncbi:hypothetical protein X961_4003 [Burkholderia pseudomallei MSHR5613]|nr:hypothetical protein X961_4003 [Burkholderia pseudomallei MSHR5613]KGX55938.1 hypothetical protein Y027_3853 [Burkholderia pseudomallei TSV5]KGX56452.1 hypothetical protein Y025_3851 [Burkholderia pseudomallei TSV32]